MDYFKKYLSLSRNMKILLTGVIFINAFIFFNINQKTIAWRHNETTQANFLWSMSLKNGSPYELKTGYNQNDLKKILMVDNFGENNTRFKEFANFIEIILFKFWQLCKITSFHNPTLIILHLTNVILIGLIINSITNSLWAALVGACFLLNSGAAISSLLFPSHINTLLIMTLFLVAYLLGKKQKTLFYIFLVLMLFTDETSLLLIPLLFCFLHLTNIRWVFNKKSIVMCTGAITLTLCLLFLFSTIKHKLGYDSSPIFLLIKNNIKTIATYFSQTSFLGDTANAFTNYFLRRNFGYWDNSFWGITSSFAVGLLTILMIRYSNKSALKIFIVLIIFIWIKSFLFPQYNGIPRHIMGPTTTFPSLLFFNYHFTYIDITLFLLAISPLLGNVLKRSKYIVILTLLITTIVSISNAIHSDEGIKDALNQHSYYQTGFKNIEKIYNMSSLIPIARHESIYLSFPSGSQPLFKRFLSSESNVWEMDTGAKQQSLLPDFIDYGSLILPQYLKLIEDGKFIISLKNIKPPYKNKDYWEILNAKYFYDVHQNILLDLEQLLTEINSPNNTPLLSSGQILEKNFSPNKLEKNSKIIFFVMGGSDITVRLDEKEIKLKQNYGFSYQMFEAPLELNKNLDIKTISLTVTPSIGNTKVVLWGPFIQKPLELSHINNP